MLFEKQSKAREMIETEILLAVSIERKCLEQEPVSAEEDEQYCKNIKLLAEAFAAVNGW